MKAPMSPRAVAAARPGIYHLAFRSSLSCLAGQLQATREHWDIVRFRLQIEADQQNGISNADGALCALMGRELAAGGEEGVPAGTRLLYLLLS